VRDLKSHQAVVLPMVGKFGGRIIDTAGDGILGEFPSVLNAVKCAVAFNPKWRKPSGRRHKLLAIDRAFSHFARKPPRRP
jgi:adenylate cyclase